ncbi:MAG: DUF4407 domain-containing protein [Candidatus Cyclobacteriaceae bacterium M2_1C_046]
MSRFRSFFWWCAGIDKSVIDKCSTETSKYVGIGASIFFTGIFASLAAGFAMFTVFDSVLYSILLGILWGLMIFNLDRYIVSSMRKKGKLRSELAMAAPRIILAIVISIVIAKPLELKIFEKEITSEILLMEQEEISRKENIVKGRFISENEMLKTEIRTLQEEIDTKAEKRDELRRIAQEEADGTGGTGLRNAGPIYRIKKANADQAEAELQELKQQNNELIAQKRAEINENDSLQQVSLNAMENASLGGLASRLEAMDRITERSEAILLAHWFILLLFIAIESAPIFVKLMAPRGPYDYLQNSVEYEYEAHHYEDVAYINTKIKNRSSRLTAEEAEYMNNKLKVGLEKN